MRHARSIAQLRNAFIETKLVNNAAPDMAAADRVVVVAGKMMVAVERAGLLL
jgi:hypothetical protein